MPEMTGLETAKLLRDFEKKVNKNRVPIICITGYDDSELTCECKENGINEVLTKPIERQKLLKILEK